MKTSPDSFQIPDLALKKYIQKGVKTYKNDTPFPHIVFDDFLPEALAHQLEAQFPGPDHDFWQQFNDVSQGKQRSIKSACNDPTVMPGVIRNCLEYFNSKDFLSFLSKLTGIENLVNDTQLIGGGMHMLKPGGFLGIHSDFNYHPETKLDRRLNLLLYLNKNWKPSYGGYLELWERDMSKRSKNIAPIFNRCVIFSTTSTSFHGNPIEVSCPPSMARKSLALYYYTDGRPESEKNESHSTLYQDRPSGFKSLVLGAKRKVKSLLSI